MIIGNRVDTLGCYVWQRVFTIQRLQLLVEYFKIFIKTFETMFCSQNILNFLETTDSRRSFLVELNSEEHIFDFKMSGTSDSIYAFSRGKSLQEKKCIMIYELVLDRQHVIVMFVSLVNLLQPGVMAELWPIFFVLKMSASSLFEGGRCCDIRLLSSSE